MNSFKNNVQKMIVTAAVMIAGLVTLTTLTGCDEYGLGGYGGYGDYGYDMGGGGFGPIESNAFQNAANDWDSYITGDYAGGGGNYDPELTGEGG